MSDIFLLVLRLPGLPHERWVAHDVRALLSGQYLVPVQTESIGADDVAVVLQGKVDDFTVNQLGGFDVGLVISDP
jgi:hypothetical protein